MDEQGQERFWDRCEVASSGRSGKRLSRTDLDAVDNRTERRDDDMRVIRSWFGYGPGNCYQLPQSLTPTCGRDESSLRSRQESLNHGVS